MPVFLGIDLVAVIVAFTVSRQGLRRRERVQVSAQEVRVTLETPRGARILWASPTAFTRVALTGDGQGAGDLRLSLSGRELAVAGALSRGERLDFAQDLEIAIRRARAERWD